MYQYLKFLLPLYGVLYFLFLIVIRALTVRKEIGKNPLVLTVSDDAHGLIGRYFMIWMILLSVYIVIFALFPMYYTYFLPIEYLDSMQMKILGLVILAISLIWTYIAQAHMRNSWRVGIDEKQDTELITTGVFRYSRNPIYLGMIATVVGLFLVTPNGLTLMLGIVGYILIQIQVRLEEEFLARSHGQSYIGYKAAVHRFI